MINFNLKNFSPITLLQVCISTIAALLCININAQNWEELNDPPFDKDHSNGFGYLDYAYIMEGSSNNVWQYAPATDAWIQLPDFPGASRSIAIGDDWNGKYYYGFGYGSGGDLSDLWEFNPADTSWVQLPSCPCVGRSHPALIAHNDKIFMATGSGPSGDLDDFWEYDMTSQTWTQKMDIPGGNRHHPFQFHIDSTIYIGGGHKDNWIAYDMTDGSLVEIDNLPLGRVAGTQFSYGGKGFILAGDDASHVSVPDVETFMYYDKDAAGWDYLPSLPTGSRWAPSSFIVNDILYFFGGSPSTSGDYAMWKFDLSYLVCLPPSNLNAVQVTSESAGLLWFTDDNSTADTLKWRKVGEPSWNVVANATATYALNDLETCQEYEFYVVKSCAELPSPSEIYTFKTDGCCTNPELSLTSLTETGVTLQWLDVLAANNYELRYKAVDSLSWTNIVVNYDTATTINLTQCTEYEVQIQSNCTNTNYDGYSDSFKFLSNGCGDCTDNVYCNVNVPSYIFDYINKVEINDYSNISGNNQGYDNFSAIDSVEVNIGESIELTIEPASTSGYIFGEIVVWIDFNSNGNFESDEIVVNDYLSDESTFTIDIPNSAAFGLTRMRIAYGYGLYEDPCNSSSSYFYGEIEDYCLDLKGTAITVTDVINLEENNLIVFPNPFRDKIYINASIPLTETHNLEIFDLNGELVLSQDNYDANNPIDLSFAHSGVYVLIIENETERFKTRIVKMQ